jgi:hypothetical protein
MYGKIQEELLLKADTSSSTVNQINNTCNEGEGTSQAAIDGACPLPQRVVRPLLHLPIFGLLVLLLAVGSLSYYYERK